MRRCECSFSRCTLDNISQIAPTRKVRSEAATAFEIRESIKKKLFFSLSFTLGQNKLIPNRKWQIVLFYHLLSEFVLLTAYFKTREKSKVALMTFEVSKTKNRIVT